LVEREIEVGTLKENWLVYHPTIHAVTLPAGEGMVGYVIRLTENPTTRKERDL
jgi:hypothetical protein